MNYKYCLVHAFALLLFLLVPPAHVDASARAKLQLPIAKNTLLTAFSNGYHEQLRAADQFMTDLGKPLSSYAAATAQRLDKLTSTENLFFTSAIIGIVGIMLLRRCQVEAKLYHNKKRGGGFEEEKETDKKMLKDRIERALKIAIVGCALTPATLFAKWAAKRAALPLLDFFIGRPCSLLWQGAHGHYPSLQQIKPLVILYAIYQYQKCIYEFDAKEFKDNEQYKKIVDHKRYKKLKQDIADAKKGLNRLWWALFVL